MGRPLLQQISLRDNGVLLIKTEPVMKSKSYRNPANKSQETPASHTGTFESSQWASENDTDSRHKSPIIWENLKNL
jgi:hypothetical protein